jgi:hypothetical protein
MHPQNGEMPSDSDQTCDERRLVADADKQRQQLVRASGFSFPWSDTKQNTIRFTRVYHTAWANKFMNIKRLIKIDM